MHVFKNGSSIIVHALIVLLSRASPHPASCFPAQLIVRYLQFEIRHYNVQNAAQMRTISSVWSACGPSPQLRTFLEALYVGLNLGLWLASLADSKTRIAGAGESCLALLYRYAALDCKVKCVIVPVGNWFTFIFQVCRYRESTTPVKNLYRIEFGLNWW